MPLFPVDSDPSPDTVADWVESYVLSNAASYKRGDLKTVLSQEDVPDAELLELQVWEELNARQSLFGRRWPLSLDGNIISLPHPGASSDGLLAYRFFGLLGLGQATGTERTLFEEVVAAMMSRRFGGNLFRIGHPASPGLDKSFRSRVRYYADKAGLSDIEIAAQPLPDDKDLGLDLVAWLPSSDGRGGDLHFVFQCATGRNWEEKLADVYLPAIQPHLNWAVPPVRLFCVPHVLRMHVSKWDRSTRKGGLILDRARLVEIAPRNFMTPTLKLQVQSAISALSVA